jgi:hypothetical protein
MAETLISPGVLARENDSSFVSQGPVTAGAAIIGPTVRGPVEIPTVVTSYSDYINKFGDVFTSGGLNYSFFTSITAYNYFNNGGTSLLVARVVSGAYSPATSSIDSNVSNVAGAYATGSVSNLNTINTSSYWGLAFQVNNNVYWVGAWEYQNELISNTGDYYYFNPTGVYGDNSWTFQEFTGSLINAINNPAFELSQYITASMSGNNLIISSSTQGTSGNGFKVYTNIQNGWDVSWYNPAATLGGGINGTTATVFDLSTLSEGIIMNSDGTQDASGSLTNGTANNIRWQIVNSNATSGTFDLLIRQGNDTTLEPTVLETWTNLSLDPFSPNYISKVLGDQYYTLQTDGSTGTKYLQLVGEYPNLSKYVRVSSVTYTTPNYFLNNGSPNPAYADYLPLNVSGSFGGATGNIKAGANMYGDIDSSNTQGLEGANYNNMISLLANADDYKYNVMLTPGLYDAGYASQVSQIITNTQNRGDAIYVLDPVAYGAGSIATVTSQAAARNTSYAAEYWPWVQIKDPGTGANVWVPASTVIAGVYAYNDSVSEPWFAPAGINRGGLSQVIRAERRLPQGDRDTLYQGKVNPIATFPGTGVVVYGQKTLQTRASALDRVNVRRLLIALKSYISQVANTLVFEQNSVATRNNFLAQVNPYLESVQQRQGLFAFKVIMDASNNTADVIDRNQMVGQIYVQPTKTAEFIYLDFIITPTGATFPG